MSLKGADGTEYLWVGDPAYWREHAPVLFPIVGALRENKAKIHGEWVEMNRHGFAKRSEFTVKEQREDTIALRLTANEATRKVYPFDFALTVAYTLTQEGVTTAFTVENLGKEEIPFVIGGHPGFNIPVGENAAFEDYTIQFEEAETQRCPVIEADSCLINNQECAYELTGEREIPPAPQPVLQRCLVFRESPLPPGEGAEQGHRPRGGDGLLPVPHAGHLVRQKRRAPTCAWSPGPAAPPLPPRGTTSRPRRA